MIKRVMVAAALLSVGTGALYPCGGPEYFVIDLPFADPELLIERLYGLDYYWGPNAPPQAGFLYPLMAAHLDRRQAGWIKAALDRTPEPDQSAAKDSSMVLTLDGLHAALGRGDRAAASRAAHAIVERVLDFPAPIADRNQAPFRRAVEYLELENVLDRRPIEDVRAFVADSVTPAVGWPAELLEAIRIRSMSRPVIAAYADSAPDSPRAPSLRFVALQERMKREIPNGFTAEEIVKAAPTGLWDSLMADHDLWLTDFPNSPLADLVRLSRLRPIFFAGQHQAAWRLLLDFYPDRHPARILYEIRLTTYDSAGSTHPRTDLPLQMALRPGSGASGWCEEWRATEASDNKAWALAEQEQLLYRVGSYGESGSLPDCFPAKPEARTEFWGLARLAALVRRGDDSQVRAQLALIDGPAVAPIVARFAIREGRWVDAALVPGLDSAAVLYLVRVLAPSTAVDRLTKTENRWIREEAALTRAIARSVRGDWGGGAAVLKRAGSGRVERWLRATTLAKDTSWAGRLAFARFLSREQGRLFYPHDRVWYRSVVGRLRGLEYTLTDPRRKGPPPPDSVRRIAAERDRIRAHLLQTTEGYLALRLYRSVLDQATATTPDLAGMVSESDRLYRSLVDWSNASTTFWADQLTNSPEARAIRKAGRLARTP